MYVQCFCTPLPYLPIMHERRNDRPSRYILVHLQWGEVTTSLTLSRMKNKVKVLYFSFQSSLPLEWHFVEIPYTGFYQNRSRNMENTGRNSFNFQCTVKVPWRRIQRNLSLLKTIRLKNSLENFFTIWSKV